MAYREATYPRGLRRLLVFGNLFFCLLGCAVIAVGVYLIIAEIQFVSFVYGTYLMAASCYFIIAAGCVMFIISFIGCFGSLFEYRTLLLVYCVTLSSIFVIALIGSVLAIVFSAWVADMVRVYMLEYLLDHYGYQMEDDWNNLVTRSWDEAQEKWQCCGVDDNGWTVYIQTNWYKDLPGATGVDKPYVPASCCVRSGYDYVNQGLCQYTSNGPPGRRDGLPNPYLYTMGCLNAGRRKLEPIAAYFIAIGFILSFIVIGGIITSFMLHQRL